MEGLMREMGIRPVYPKPNLSRPSKGSKRFPYLLKNKTVRFANQVWGSDETPVQLRGLIAGFVEQYNNGRIHESLGCETPAEWYLSNGWPEQMPEAA